VTVSQGSSGRVAYRDRMRFEEAGLTYPEVGATRDGPAPAGYRQVRRDAPIGRGRPAFERAVDGLFGWHMHRRAGLEVVGPVEEAAAGVTVLLRAGWGPFHLMIPCRVVYTVEESGRKGFAYGTLPGHPEQGEEAFTLELTATDEVRFRIYAFSRPASRLARAGGPLTRLAQQHATNRYVTAMRALAR
jgi:uncharacterized protein (UPF0548 family)